MGHRLQMGLKCKACGKAVHLDYELCDECMIVVMDYNKDILDKTTCADLEETL